MITSRQNPLVKLIKSLNDKKNRDELGLFVVEGLKSVKEALKSSFTLYKIVATQKGLSLLGDLNSYAEKQAEVEILKDDVFESISGEVSPQGVLAVMYKPSNNLILPKSSCLFLDGVSDSGNVGAIIRSAAASGYTDIYLAECADAYSPKSVRASMSGIFKVNIISGTREQLLSLIDKPVIVADMGGQNIFEFKIKEDFCLVIGNEAHGVSALIKEKAKYTVSIPMQNGVESLNASVSAGILMYALKI